ncbi:MAG: AAA family ATPase [Hyphomicrobiaceae bacterium]
MDRFALSYGEIAAIVTIVGGILAAAYTLFRWGKSHGKTEGVIEGESTSRQTIETMRTARDDAKHDLRTARDEAKALRDHIEVLKSKTPELDPKVKKLLEIRDKIAGDDIPLWRIHEAKPLPRYHELMRSMALRVITVANEKGGVGKTTTVANLAGFFDRKMKKRVLVIDLDHQGSSSTMLLQAAGKKVESSLAEHLISGQFDGKWVQQVARDLSPALPRTRILTAVDIFADFEERLMQRWVLGIVEDDVRYNLAKVLLSPEIQANYDTVLIDVGPRLTLGAINALVASTHLVVPTVLDQLAAERVGYFLKNASTFRDLFNPNLKLAGVLGTMTYQQRLTDNELDTLASVKESLGIWGSGGHIFQQNIPRKQSLANSAGNDVAYLRHNDIARLFDRFGNELMERLAA